MINHLTGGHFRINKLSTSGDTRVLRQLLTQLDSGGGSGVYYCNNAGSVARFLMPLLAITPGHHTLTGDERLCQRPMAPLIDALRQMGLRVECTGQEGFLPVYIQGGVPTRRTVSVDPLLSSQFVSALLLIAPRMPEGISLTMTQRPTSRPYIEMTCDALRQAGIEVRRSSNGRTYYVQHIERKPKAAVISVERDWSSASYFYTMALLRPDLRIRLLGLQLDSCQCHRCFLSPSRSAVYRGALALQVGRPFYHHSGASTRCTSLSLAENSVQLPRLPRPRAHLCCGCCCRRCANHSQRCQQHSP